MTSLALGLKLSAIKTLSAVQRAINILKSAGPGAWYDPSDLTQAKATWRRNLLTYSEQFDNAAWAKQVGGAGVLPVVTANAATAPDGTTTADLIVFSTPAGGSDYSIVLSNSAPTVTGTPYTGSVRIKAAGAGDIGKRITFWHVAAGAQVRQITLTDSWQTYSVSESAYSTSANLRFGLYPGTGGSSGTVAVHVWGAQLEVGSTASTYQPITNFTSDFLAAFPQHALYQDSAGTTPVTAVEQPVGLILDKSGGGNHAIQPTATSRPTLSSRYNLLTKTEQFDDAYWGKWSYAVSIVPNATAAPDGTITADAVVNDAGGGLRGLTATFTPAVAGNYRISFRVKQGSEQVLMLREEFSVGGTVTFDLATGATTGSNDQTIEFLPDGWCVISATWYCPTAYCLFHLGRERTGDLPSAAMFYVWGASLTTAADASRPYQRVNTATDYDYDFSKFPPYLKFDGVDDSLYTAASVDFTSTDKMTVFAGVHKASEVGTQTLLEMSPNKNSNTGVFAVFAPITGGNGDITWASKGTVEASASAAATAVSTQVFTGLGDIAGDIASLRVNGVTSTSTTDQGTGNFGNYPLYIGRRNNASLPFNGRIYQLAIKGKAMTAAEISTLESYINSKTKAF